MPIQVVTGPPFSGKGQKVAAARQPGDVVLDTTPIWKTFASPEPGDVRTVEDAAIANCNEAERVSSVRSSTGAMTDT